MDIDQAFRLSARAASDATRAAMKKYRQQGVIDEDDLTGVLVGRLDAAFEGTHGGLHWSSSILRHRSGVAAQEKRIGADMLIHVSIDTPKLKYSKGVLIQAKRVEPDAAMSRDEHKELIDQCNKMLAVSPAAFVFDYAKGEMRCASATRIVGSTSRELYSSCDVTPYRFFLELFRCATGDRNIMSSLVEDLQVPLGISLQGRTAPRA